MMRVVPISEEITRRDREQHEVRRRLAATKPQLTGAAEAAMLMDRREFIFRGRTYRVPPVPWEENARMAAYREQLRMMRHADAVQVIRDIAALSKSVCYPKNPIRRLFWRVSPNPFLKATVWEAGRHLGFFWLCHVLDDEKLSVLTTDHPGTSSQNSPASSSGTQRGATPKASRSRGRTSLSGSGA